MIEPSPPDDEQVPPPYFGDEKLNYDIPQVIRSLEAHKKRLGHEIDSIDKQMKMLNVIAGRDGQGPSRIQRKGIVTLLSETAVKISRITEWEANLFLPKFSNNGGHTDLESFAKAYFDSQSWKREIISKEIVTDYKNKWGKLLCIGEVEEELQKYLPTKSDDKEVQG